MDIIVDIDGTLADVTHRLHHIRKAPKDWDGFFMDCKGDAPIEAIISLVRSLEADIKNNIILCSGRPERTREMTTNWLVDNGILWSRALYMRADGDFREDTVIKRELLLKIRADGFHPVIAIDDRKQVVDMWREEGLVCAQVAAGDF